MSRYIDAEWLKELYKPYESYNGKELAVPIGAILANIDDAPSIDIVRCGECKYSKSSVDDSLCCTQWHDCYGFWEEVKADAFCSYGEIETDE